MNDDAMRLISNEERRSCLLQLIREKFGDLSEER